MFDPLTNTKTFKIGDEMKIKGMILYIEKKFFKINLTNELHNDYQPTSKLPLGCRLGW